METKTFGIVGLSWITADEQLPGTHRVLGMATPHTHLSAIANIPEATVVAGCDIADGARERFLERWEPVWPGVKVYDDYRQMFEETRPDVVCVATPDNLHLPVVVAALDAGIKGIFCEKPISTHTDDVDTMIAAIEAAGATVNVNHTRRWMPPYVTAREALRDGKIGDLVQVIGHLGGERAMLWRNHSHMIDLVTYFADANPEWVVAELEPGFEDYGTRYKGDGGRDPGLEPSMNAYIAYDNGVRVFLSGMKRATPMLSVELIGTTGKILANDNGAILLSQSEVGLASTPLTPRGTVAGNQGAILDLLHAMETGESPECPPREARKTVAIIEGILASQAAGNARVAIS